MSPIKSKLLKSSIHSHCIKWIAQEINETCDIVRCRNAEVPMEKIFGVRAFDFEKIVRDFPFMAVEQSDKAKEDGEHDHHSHEEHGNLLLTCIEKNLWEWIGHTHDPLVYQKSGFLRWLLT